MRSIKHGVWNWVESSIMLALLLTPCLLLQSLKWLHVGTTFLGWNVPCYLVMADACS